MAMLIRSTAFSSEVVAKEGIEPPTPFTPSDSFLNRINTTSAIWFALHVVMTIL